MGFMRPEVQVFSPRPTKKCVPYGAHFFVRSPQKRPCLLGYKNARPAWQYFFVSTAQKIFVINSKCRCKQRQCFTKFFAWWRTACVLVEEALVNAFSSFYRTKDFLLSQQAFVVNIGQCFAKSFVW